MIKTILLICIVQLHVIGQTIISVKDSSNLQPLAGAYLTHQKETLISSLEGIFSVPATIDQEDTIVIAYLGYQNYKNSLREAKKGVLMSSKTIRLNEAVIKPISAKSIIERSFELYLANHIPYPYMQKAHFHEEFVNRNAKVRVQDFEMEVYQYPKNRSLEERAYYLGGGNVKINSVSKVDDSVQIEKVKQAIGPKLSRHINFDEITSYSFVKGGNVLNIIYTALLSNQIAHEHKEYKIVGTLFLYGTQVYEIEIKHFHKNRHVMTSKIYIDKESYAVVAFSTLANKNMEEVSFFDFKTKVVMWLLGVKIKVKQYYAKVIFEKNIQNVWTVKDCIIMAPGVFERKNIIDGYLYAHYSMNPTIFKSSIPDGKTLNEHNLNLIQKTYHLKQSESLIKPQEVYHQYKNKLIK